MDFEMDEDNNSASDIVQPPQAQTSPKQYVIHVQVPDEIGTETKTEGKIEFVTKSLKSLRQRFNVMYHNFKIISNLKSCENLFNKKTKQKPYRLLHA